LKWFYALHFHTQSATQVIFIELHCVSADTVFLRNVGSLLPDDKVSKPRRLQGIFGVLKSQIL
jgi:hypothetical protein